MNKISPDKWMRWVRVAVAGSIAALLLACATGPKEVWQKFAFSGGYDGWEKSADLLAYEYGNGDRMVRDSVDKPRGIAYKDGTSLPPQTNINGPMPIGEFLYVRWRVKATGQVHEQRVDLRNRLPTDMKDHGLTFVIDGAQLYVYVITPRPKPFYGAPPITRTWHSATRYTYEIFPQITKP